MLSPKRAMERLIRNLEIKRHGAPPNVRVAIEEILNYIKEDKDRVIVYTPQSITACLSRPRVASFEWFRCPLCGRLYEWKEAEKSLRCEVCKKDLLQAYVGAPTGSGSKIVERIDRFPSTTQSWTRDYLVLPTVGAKGIYCKQLKKYKGLKATNPNRPFYSLGFVCPDPTKDCPHRRGEFCTEGRGRRGVFWGHDKAIAHPSEGITRPFSEVVFEELEEEEDLTSDFNKLLGDNIFSRVSIGKFRVCAFTLFYLVGHSYAARSSRIPVYVVANNKVWIAGRSMTTSGLILCLKSSAVKGVEEGLKSLVDVDKLTITHSMSHAAMKALVRLTGLSFREFGEAVYVGEEEPEVLIYDDSPGGIGGAKAVSGALADFANYLKDEARPCPRACRRACRACLYVENCGSLNFYLSWMAVNYYLGGSTY
ncbi:MAG: DUF1998 domain-containing protein [Acidilobaceae archaeon]